MQTHHDVTARFEFSSSKMAGFEITSLNSLKVRGLLYGLVALASMVVFGNISEICDSHDHCPARLIWIIVFAVAAAIVSSVMLAATLLKIGALLKIEVPFSLSLLVLYSICVGLVSSIRTGLGNVIAVSFSWFCLVVAFILLFATITADGGLLQGLLNKKDKVEDIPRDLELGKREQDGAKDQDGVEVPEEAYMHSSGEDLGNEVKQEAGEIPLKPVESEVSTTAE